MLSRKNKIISPFKPARHKHQRCLQSAVEAATKHCDVLGLRLTPIRQRVLELVWQNHEPVKAYDILDQLKHIVINIYKLRFDHVMTAFKMRTP